MLEPYRSVLYPEAEPYKRVVLDGARPPFDFRGRFWKDEQVSETAVLSPVDIVENAIDDEYGISDDFEIVNVEDPNPDNYPAHKALRIRGQVPVVAKFADELTPVDPRFAAHNRHLHLSLDDTEITSWEQDRNAIVFGRPMSQDMFEQALAHGLADPEFEGNQHNPGQKTLLKLGKEVSRRFEINVSFGGDLWIPREDKPHGQVGVSAVYAWDDSYNVEQFMRSIFEENEHDEYDVPSCDEVTIVSEFEKDVPWGPFVRVWWD